MLAVPMLKDEELIGAIHYLPPGSSPLYRQADRAWSRTSPPKPSSPSRTRGCSTNCRQSLEQQTATSDVLRSSAARQRPTGRCSTTLEQAVAQLCDGRHRQSSMQRDGDVYLVTVAQRLGFPPESTQWSAEHRLPGDRASATGRARAQSGGQYTFPMCSADPEYGASGRQQVAGIRTALAVPLLTERNAIGVFRLSPRRGAPIHREADRTGTELRRSSRHRHRERAVAQRTASAHHRPY